MTTLPAADEMFPEAAPSADEMFPPDADLERERVRKSPTPIPDLLFSIDGPVGSTLSSAKRVLDAFGEGAKEGWGTHQIGFSQESEKYLREHGVWPDYSKGYGSTLQAVNEAIMRPAAATTDAIWRSLGGVYRGAQSAVVQIGENMGSAQAGRDIASIPDAFMGSPHPTGITRRNPTIELMDRAADLKVVGPGGEAAFRGTVEVPISLPDNIRPAEPIRPAREPAPLPVQPVEPRSFAQKFNEPVPIEDAVPTRTIAADITKSGDDVIRSEPVAPNLDKAGNIVLKNLGTPEDVNAIIRETASKNDDFINARRGVISDGQVLDLADALGMDASALSVRKLGEAFNAEEVMAARKLLIRSAEDLRDAMSKAAAGDDAAVMAYAEVRSRHQMIQEQVSGITAEAGRALRAFRSLEGGQEAKALSDFLKQNTGRTLDQLRREAELGMTLDTPAQVSRFVNEVRKPGMKDMFIEAWLSWILSGVKTHVANITGNTITALWHPVETATAAAIGKGRSLVTGSTDRVRFGEAPAELFGMIQGSREGVVAAWKAFRTEEPVLTGARQVEQGVSRAIPSKTFKVAGKEFQVGGKQLRIPLRLLTAEDELFKAISFRASINRQAYVIASKEGLTAESRASRIAELSMSPTNEMVTAAKAAAEKATFQTPLGEMGRSIQNFSNGHVLAKIVLPFIRTPLNLLKFARDRSPLGVFSREVRENLAGKNGNVARDTQIAQITLGTTLGVTLYGMAADGTITGGGPADPRRRALMIASGWQPYSVKIGESYYSYQRLDPFSIIMGVAADHYEIEKALKSDHPERERLAALIFGAVSKNVLERSSLRGASDLVQAVNDPERYGMNYIKNLAASFTVPAIVNHATQTMDPIVRESRTLLDGIKARTPFLSETLKARRDVWGEIIQREGAFGPDFASPIYERHIKNDPVSKALLDVGLYPGRPQRKLRNVELSDKAFDDYQRIAGRTSRQLLTTIVGQPGFEKLPQGVRRDLMAKAIERGRKYGQNYVLMLHPEIMEKASKLKTERMAQ